MSTTVVSAELASYFEKLGLFLPLQGEKRRISPSSLSPSHFTSPNFIDGTRVFSSASIHEAQEFIEIPLVLQSRETAEIVGFGSEKAQSIWNSWQGVPDDEKSDEGFLQFLLDFIRDHTGPEQAINSEDDWSAYMDSIGISDRLKTAILLPEYEIIRYTASCQHWLIDSVEWTYRSLQYLQERFATVADHLKSTGFKVDEKERVRRASSPSKFPSLPSPTHRKPQNAKEEPATPVPDSNGTKLYRATTAVRARSFYNPKSGLVTEGRFGSFPGDLSGQSALTYWTPQREVADMFAGYLKHRVPIDEIIITEVDVSKELVSSLRRVYLWGEGSNGMNPHFQEFTWSCRNRYQKNEMPEYLKYLTKRDLIIAHIFDHKATKYERMVDWKNIKASDLLRVEIGGEEKLAIQWAFRSSYSKNAFNDHCRGRVTQYNLKMLTMAEVTPHPDPIGSYST
ncbi:hypothetical protein TWF481_006322 [Arthrobotrys musiformis]|uniref:Uncharacterized protein n=1 Tax=Arthrobotrys musiformis TaxID=47236 RepID=A0AAV9WHC1_9PEZI